MSYQMNIARSFEIMNTCFRTSVIYDLIFVQRGTFFQPYEMNIQYVFNRVRTSYILTVVCNGYHTLSIWMDWRIILKIIFEIFDRFTAGSCKHTVNFCFTKYGEFLD